MISRYFISFNFAAVITFATFLSMQMLISQGDIVVKEKLNRIPVVFDKIRKIEPVTPKDMKPIKKEYEETPELTSLDLLRTNGGENFNVSVLPNVIPAAPTLSSTGYSLTTDGDLISILRPAPQYPRDMAAKGIEGYVRLKYTVTEIGSTEDVVVMSSSHRGFERSAVKAAQKFKFKPRIEDGVAIVVPDVHNTIEFKLEN